MTWNAGCCEAFDELWDSFVDPADALSSTSTALRWGRLGGSRCGRAAGAGMPFATETATGRDPRPVPRAGGRQRVRHQRPRKPHQLHRRQRAHLPGGGRAAARLPADRWSRDVQAVLDEFVRDEPLAPAAAGDRPPQGPRRRVLPAAVRRPPTAPRGCGSSSRTRWPRRPTGWPTRRPASASRPTRTTWRPCWATGSTAGWSTPPRSSTARRTSTPT